MHIRVSGGVFTCGTVVIAPGSPLFSRLTVREIGESQYFA